jgi:hypothetical protein
MILRGDFRTIVATPTIIEGHGESGPSPHQRIICEVDTKRRANYASGFIQSKVQLALHSDPRLRTFMRRSRSQA